MQRYPSPDMSDVAGVLDRRAEALLVDAVLVGVAMMAVGYAAGTVLLDGPFGGFGGTVIAAQFLAPFALLIYQTGLEGYYGQTVGKRLRGIVVVREDGSRCTWGAAVVRNLLRVVDALPAFYIVGIASAYLIGEQQRIGDIAGNTVVVYTE